MGLCDQGRQNTQSCCWYWSGTQWQGHSQKCLRCTCKITDFLKRKKIPAQGFSKALHACIRVYACSQSAELLVSHMAALKSLSSTLKLQKKIPLCLTHILFVEMAQAINISHQTHCSSSKHTEFPFCFESAWKHVVSPCYSQTAFCSLAINVIKQRNCSVFI